MNAHLPPVLQVITFLTSTCKRKRKFSHGKQRKPRITIDSHTFESFGEHKIRITNMFNKIKKQHRNRGNVKTAFELI